MGPEKHTCRPSSSLSKDMICQPLLQIPSMRACRSLQQKAGMVIGGHFIGRITAPQNVGTTPPPLLSQCTGYSHQQSPVSQPKMPVNESAQRQHTLNTWDGPGYTGHGPRYFSWQYAPLFSACGQETQKACRAREYPPRDGSNFSMKSGGKSRCSTPCQCIWRDGGMRQGYTTPTAPWNTLSCARGGKNFERCWQNGCSTLHEAPSPGTPLGAWGRQPSNSWGVPYQSWQTRGDGVQKSRPNTMLKAHHPGQSRNSHPSHTLNPSQISQQGT